jgi:hypothetical protein
VNSGELSNASHEKPAMMMSALRNKGKKEEVKKEVEICVICRVECGRLFVVYLALSVR